MSALQTLKELKEKSQDFEWYPTTDEIIEAMYWDLLGSKRFGEETYRANGKRFTMLDIGAGNGKVFQKLKEICEEQPLLNEYYYRGDLKDNNKSFRNENERYANRVFITKYMVVEKSSILTDMMPKETLVVGKDFHENTLVDKQSDVVFCNPPYSEYAQWATKIIREANAKTIYLVIPQRWGKHKGIAQALKARKAKVKIIGNFDFLNAEDRKARAYVSLVKVELNHRKFRGDRYSSRDSKVNVDPFDLWFNDYFKIKAEKKSANDYDYKEREKQEQEFKQTIKKELVSANSLIPVLVKLYEKELQKLIGNYEKLGELDAELFRELNVDINSVREAFKLKITGLKNKYWDEVFNNLDKITERLTLSTRSRLKEKLMANANIDFNESNIRSIVIWILKNANQYYEDQMLELYDTFTTGDSIKLYKSNQHFVKDNFRYNKREEKLDKYALDYRIVLCHYIDDWDKGKGRVSDKQYEHIRDVSIIGRNLGFSVDDTEFKYASRYDKKLVYREKKNIFFTRPSRTLPKGTKTFQGKIEEVYIHTNKPNKNGERVMEKEGVLYVYSKDNKSDWIQYKIGEQYYHEDSITLETDIFTTVTAYKNGNCHYQFNKKFMQKLNLEVGRIRGWLRDPIHAAEEMDISVKDAQEYWKSNFTLLPENTQNLLPQFNLVDTEKEAEEENKVEVFQNDSESIIVIQNNVDEPEKEEKPIAPLKSSQQTLFDFA